MKMRWYIFLAVSLLLFVASPRPVWADYDPAGYEINDPSDFYQPLGHFGYWVQVDNYGWCWDPSYVSSDWRPYTNGHWLWSDGGWYWVSDEPWAWATYHYGRWVWDSYYGWVWVPATEWAPAWVSWREGGDYIGWAPLPPECGFGAYGDTIYADNFAFAPTQFVFVERHRFCEPLRPSILIINQTFIYKTVNITKIRRTDRHIFNEGPRFDAVRKATTRPIPVGSVDQLRHNPPVARGDRDRTKVVPRPRGQTLPDRNGPTAEVRREIPRQRPVQGERQSGPEIIRGTPTPVVANDLPAPRRERNDRPPRIAPVDRQPPVTVAPPRREVSQPRIERSTARERQDQARQAKAEQLAAMSRSSDDSSPRDRGNKRGGDIGADDRGFKLGKIRY